MSRLDEKFFSQDVLDAAPALVGKLFVRKMPDGSFLRLRITETEAYRGEEDGACHAHKGKTARTEVMYRKGGFSYVYLIYGIHHLLNVVTGKENMPQAVLIRAMEKPFDGPGKWTKKMGITAAHNGIWLPENDEIWLEDDGFQTSVETAPRVGIDYAPEKWKTIPWRFIASNGREK